MVFNLPNTLTWLRIALIPLFVAVFYLPDGWVPVHLINIVATAIFALRPSPTGSTAISRARSVRPRPSAPSSIQSPTS
jgi:hypothetical protein